MNFLSSEGTRVGEACVLLIGGLKADGFFSGMQRIDLPQGPVFRKGSQAFTLFPDEVTLWFDALVSHCSKDFKYVGEWATWEPDFVKGLRAEAGYVRDLHFHPLEINLAKEGVTTFMHRSYWSYRFVVHTKEVRLTDTLVVYLRSKDGQQMGHFTVDLAGRTGLW